MTHPNYKLSKQLAMQETWHFCEADKNVGITGWQPLNWKMQNLLTPTKQFFTNKHFLL
jgi:hypothetical protein